MSETTTLQSPSLPDIQQGLRRGVEGLAVIGVPALALYQLRLDDPTHRQQLKAEILQALGDQVTPGDGIPFLTAHITNLSAVTAPDDLDILEETMVDEVRRVFQKLRDGLAEEEGAEA